MSDATITSLSNTEPDPNQSKVMAEHRSTILQVRSTRFDIEKKKELIEQTIASLDSYLDFYIPKGRRVNSKHSQLGPAGKMIRILRSNKLVTKDALIGQIVSIHENTGNRVYIDAKKKLEEGVDTIMKTLADVPKTKRLRVLSEIDYGLYFARKKKFLEYLDDLQKRWAEFLQKRYDNSIDKLINAWSINEDTDNLVFNPPYTLTTLSFQKLKPPTASFEKTLSGQFKQIKMDLEVFKRLTKMEPIEEEDEETAAMEAEAGPEGAGEEELQEEKMEGE